MNKLITGLLMVFVVFGSACAEKSDKTDKNKKASSENKASKVVDTPYGTSEVDFKVHKIKDTPVYYVIGQSGVPGAANEGMTSNAGFVVTEKGVVVYDALGTPVLGHRLLQEIKKVTDKPVTHVIAGHYHADHVYGLQAFKEHTKATIWAEKSAYVYIDSSDSDKRLSQRRDSLFPWVDENTYLVKPDETFIGEKTFDMGDATIELMHAGPAHSPDDIMMLVQPYGVVFSGDLIFGGRLPFLGGGRVDTKEWLAGLKKLETMDPAPMFVVPGHGTPSENPVEDIAFTRGYIEFLRTKLGKQLDQLNTFGEAYKKINWSKYKDVPTFEAANRRNAFQVYLEMERELFE